MPTTQFGIGDRVLCVIGEFSGHVVGFGQIEPNALFPTYDVGPLYTVVLVQVDSGWDNYGEVLVAHPDSIRPFKKS